MDGTYTAFYGLQRLATGPLADVLARVKAEDRDPDVPLLIFDDRSGQPVDFDLRSPLDSVLARVLPMETSAAGMAVGRGRPKLGVVAREVTLLPRHWSWLEAQPGGASAALRRLTDEARKHFPDRERVLAGQTAADRFMQTMAGDQAGYQEASRALYARDHAAFDAWVAGWPRDVRIHARHLAAPAFEEVTLPGSS